MTSRLTGLAYPSNALGIHYFKAATFLKLKLVHGPLKRGEGATQTHPSPRAPRSVPGVCSPCRVIQPVIKGDVLVLYAEDWEKHTKDMLKQHVPFPKQNWFPVRDFPVQFQAIRAKDTRIPRELWIQDTDNHIMSSAVLLIGVTLCLSLSGSGGFVEGV